MNLNSQSQATDVETALLTLLQLEQKIRWSDTLAALRFTLLNETKSLVHYEQAILWDGQRHCMVGASGVMSVDQQAPLIQWLQRQSERLSQSDRAQEVHRVDVASWAESDRNMAAEYLAGVLVWIPILDADQTLMGALWLSQHDALTIRDKRLLTFYCESAGYAWRALEKSHCRRGRIHWKQPRWLCGMALMVVALMSLPVRQSVLAPGEVVSSASQTVRMPIDGVVSRLYVKPNSEVKRGQRLLSLDSRQLDDQLAQAQQQLAIASAELRLARQQSFYDASRKASVAVLEGKRNLARSQVHYLQQKVDQSLVVAGQDGIALFDDQGDWIGRPLRLGEPVMAVADPTQTEIEVHLAVEDRMDLEPGDEVRLFLNSRPTQPVRAQLTTVAYRSTLQNDGHYAFVLKAALASPTAQPVMGLKGIAKVYGERTSLFYYLFRRPLSHLRLWWGGL